MMYYSLGFELQTFQSPSHPFTIVRCQAFSDNLKNPILQLQEQQAYPSINLSSSSKNKKIISSAANKISSIVAIVAPNPTQNLTTIDVTAQLPLKLASLNYFHGRLSSMPSCMVLSYLDFLMELICLLPKSVQSHLYTLASSRSTYSSCHSGLSQR